MKFDSIFKEDHNVKASKVLEDIDFSIFKEEREIIDRLSKNMGEDNWSSVRDTKNFELLEKEYSFGTRKVYSPVESDSNKNLQDSRGLSFNAGDTIENMVEKFVTTSLQWDEADELRRKELKQVIDYCSNNLEKLESQTEDVTILSAIRKAFLEKNNSFAEIGFRSPRILRKYKEDGYSQVRGFDINDLSVRVCKKLGWDVQFGDISGEGIDLSSFDVVVAYHVFEHVTCPLEAFKNVRKSAKHGAIFHIEIPIEPGVPRLNYGHLYPFEEGDLEAMIIEAGFIPISKSNIPHSGGPQIERITAVACNPEK